MKVRLLTLAALVLFFGCKDDDPKPTAAEKQAVLLAGNKDKSKVWIIDEFELNGDSFYPTSLDCFFDNEYTFSNNADQTFEGNEGEANCFTDPDGDGIFDSELPDQIETGQWAFSIDGKTLILLSSNFNSPVSLFSYFGDGSAAFPAEVVTLTDTVLELKMSFTYEGDSGVVTFKFVAKPTNA